MSTDDEGGDDNGGPGNGDDEGGDDNGGPSNGDDEGGDDNGGPSNGGPGNGGQTPPAQNEETEDEAEVIVEDGEITLNKDQVSSEVLEQVFDGRDSLTINLASDRVSLPAAALRNVQERGGSQIEIRTENGVYTLPMSALDLEHIAEQLDVDLEELNIRVEISPASTETADAVQARLETLGANQLAEVVSFDVIASSESGSELRIERYPDTYVSRMIAVNGQVDMSRATGVIVDPVTGEWSFVPTVFTVIDGQVYATIKHPANGVFTVVQMDKDYNDVPQTHWAREDILVLANKFIVSGTGEDTFDPDREISMAEFATLVVRALALSSEDTDLPFEDVASASWYSDAIAAAVEAGFVNGYADGSFRPSQEITRIELAIMIARAMAYAGADIELDDAEAEAILSKYADLQEMTCGKKELALAVKAGIIQGVSGDLLAPQDLATRAQAVVMLKRYLEYVGFINEI